MAHSNGRLVSVPGYNNNKLLFIISTMAWLCCDSTNPPESDRRVNPNNRRENVPPILSVHHARACSGGKPTEREMNLLASPIQPRGYSSSTFSVEHGELSLRRHRHKELPFQGFPPFKRKFVLGLSGRFLMIFPDGLALKPPQTIPLIREPKDSLFSWCWCYLYSSKLGPSCGEKIFWFRATVDIRGHHSRALIISKSFKVSSYHEKSERVSSFSM